LPAAFHFALEVDIYKEHCLILKKLNWSQLYFEKVEIYPEMTNFETETKLERKLN